MMARYIDAAKLEIALRNDYAKRIKTGRPFTIDGVEAVIDFDVPTADVMPIIHAKWMGKPIAGYANVKCSNCMTVFKDNTGKWKYCPHCGAKMDEVE